ncbi:NAD(P)/FAD-dependent oxidoreductase [Alkalibacterium olivapovliticus]|uniref:Thioredoxin reductase n=1 Tax=Alkalibacterium olivapovliticus TaxID=99907 RepID=A0A2T0W7D1_9LACT|nr:NAD(P)/FAD-dependent oxidoreductase [Alkalibacterium olivapovliticus]PRY82615.1 thioredoxin reductase [Alkalibacterium olivapovliticus]
MIDVVVIGGGPAGMSAALAAGRGRQTVVMIDEEKPRNAVTQESHGFLTRDGVSPDLFRKRGREDLMEYPTISLVNERVILIEKNRNDSFSLTTESGSEFISRTVILATGLKDTLPEVNKIDQYYGRSIFSCPFCDGWELKDKRLILIVNNEKALHLIKLVRNWSDNLIVATNGRAVLNEEEKELLGRNNVQLVESIIMDLTGKDGMIKSVRFEGDYEIAVDGGFCTTHLKDETPFVRQLGLKLNKGGFVEADMMGRTNVSGVYAIGEITGPSQLIVSASQGHLAGAGLVAEYADRNFNK